VFLRWASRNVSGFSFIVRPSRETAAENEAAASSSADPFFVRTDSIFAAARRCAAVGRPIVARLITVT
jgi:hypothetical protein